MTPREIVSELDRYIVGQRAAKRAVAIALRNRWRRQQVPEDLRDEIAPKNIIMIGPTGVGKTEISRRLAKLAQRALPEGRGVEVHRGRLRRARRRVDHPRPGRPRDRHGEGARRSDKVVRRAREVAEERLLDLLLPSGPTPAAWRRRRRAAREHQQPRDLPPLAPRGQARRPHGRARGHQERRRRWSRS